VNRVKNFNSTGIATDGRLYAGDLNLMQDGAAAQSDFAQTIDLQSLRIGASDLQLTRFGVAEGQFSGALRTAGILRGLGGIIAGAFTTTQRDAIAVGFAPYGIIILNTTTNQYEWNSGTDAARSWKPIGPDFSGSIIFTGGASKIGFINKTALASILTAMRSGDGVNRFALREDGREDWGSGAGAVDTALYRDAAGRLRLDNELNLGGYSIYFGNLGASLMIDGVASRIRGGTMSIQNADGSVEHGFIGANFYRYTDGRFGVRAQGQQKLTIAYGTFTSTVSTPSTDAVSFGMTFAEPPHVWVSPIGSPADPIGPGTPTLNVRAVTTTQFGLLTGAVGSVVRWAAIGIV
jgi:hypothetical protein